MRLATFWLHGAQRCGAVLDDGIAVFQTGSDIGALIAQGHGLLEFRALAEAATERVAPKEVRFLPPCVRPSKIVCVGLNYAAHTQEATMAQPSHPTVFLRLPSSITGHEATILRPPESEQLDYEGEMVAVLGSGGRRIPRERALDCVFGYAVGNEVSVRDFQFKSPQWTLGKNVDRTAAWGPWLVTHDEVPRGGAGLKLQTRINDRTVQSANTRDMIFDLATVIATLSDAMTLEAGDVIWTGTPAGVGLGHKPPLWLRDGDVVEVEIEGLGLLRNTVKDEVLPTPPHECDPASA